MRTISFSQLIVLMLVLILIFGDISIIMKKIKKWVGK